MPPPSPKPFSTRLTPWAARAWAMPRPMPLVEPVTMAVLPFSMRLLRFPEDVLGAGAGRLLGGDGGAGAHDLGLQLLDIGIQLGDAHDFQVFQGRCLLLRLQL